MKTIKYLSIAFLAATFAGQGNLSAQPGDRNNEEHKIPSTECKTGKEHPHKLFIPNLSEEQKGKIKDYDWPISRKFNH